MRGQQPTTQTIKASDVRQNLAQLLNKVFRKETRVLVEKSGIPVAAIVSADDLERLDRLDQEWAARTAALEAFGAAFADVPAEESEREIARIVARVRAEDEARHGVEEQASVERQPA